MCCEISRTLTHQRRSRCLSLGKVSLVWWQIGKIAIESLSCAMCSCTSARMASSSLCSGLMNLDTHIRLWHQCMCMRMKAVLGNVSSSNSDLKAFPDNDLKVNYCHNFATVASQISAFHCTTMLHTALANVLFFM